MSKLVLKSEQKILADMVKVILAKTGLNDLNPGSVLLTLLQAASTEDFAQYYQMLQIVRNYNLDTTSGTDLENRAFEYGLTRQQAVAASGKITILRESTFEKVSTTFYTGVRSRIAGDTEIFVNNAENFPTSGGAQTLIIGRDTPNEEEVTYTPSGSNPEDNTNYFKITLDLPLSNDHSLEETIILKQGVDITIPSGTVVRVPASGRTPEITFSTIVEATILAGESQIDDVDVLCSTPGILGNISINAITDTTAFPNPPFNGARAQNDSAFSDGKDKETDTKLRNRIKAHIQSLTQSTKAGIANAIDGLVDPDTAKRVVSSNIILPDNAGLPVKIYIDDGTGFEPSFRNQGQETIISDAQGGETRLQLDLFPLVKAQVETLSEEPFDFSTNGLTLQLQVGNITETITFFTSDFAIPEAATSEEVIKAINNRATLIEARTSQVGKKIVINAKVDTNENIQVLGGTANTKFNFPTNIVQTFYLYKNDKLLSKDGETAIIDSGNSAPFDFSGSDKALSITVDKKTTNIQTVTIHESDFDSPAAAAQATAAQIAAIINAQLAGATAVDANGKVRIISNTELSSDSAIKINTSDANTVLDFSTTQVVGKDQDYTLNPELGIIELSEPLVENDRVTAGTRNTRAFLTAGTAEDYTFSGGETLDIEIDGDTAQTTTFTAGTFSAAQTADIINAQLVGGSAVTRTSGVDVFLEIRTNTLSDNGSIEILSSSTGNSVFEFELDTLVENLPTHTAYVISQSSGPYVFVEGYTLVVILDNNPVGKTFVITMDFDSEVSTGTSTTIFAASDLSSVFVANDDINDFWAIFKSGSNTISGTVTDVTNPTGTTFRYIFDAPPTNFEDFAVGDQASFSDLESAINNGNFLITGIVTVNNVHSSVLDKDVDNPSALTPLSGDRYLVAPTAALSVDSDDILDKDIANPSALTPSAGDRYIVAPGANDTALDNVKGLYTDSNDVSVSETHGYRYIINGVGTNDWAGHDNEIAQYNGVGTPGWLFITPSDEDIVLDEASSNYYQFNSGLGQWEQNDWGSKAGKVVEWGGSTWDFTTPVNNEVRNVTDEALKYQYDSGTNTWEQNDWGGNGNQIAEWNGSSWDFTVPATNDTVDVDDESLTYQYSGSSWAEFKFWVEVTNSAGETEAGSSGTGLIGQRRQITDYTASTGTITLANALRATPSNGDAFIVLPYTKENVVDYFNNTKITSLSTKAYIELAEQADYIQLSSKQNGSDGYIQVTGGRANLQLQFSNSLFTGLRAYGYYIGLIKLVHRTIYGDETDLVSFPGVGAVGIKFQVLAPTVQEVPVSVEVTLAEGISLSSVENEIKTQIIAYIRSLGVAGEVVRASIVDKVIGIEGISDVEVVSPAQNVIIAQNELASTKASIITVNVAD